MTDEDPWAGIPIVESKYLPQGKAYLFNGQLITSPEAVAIIVDDSWPARWERALHYLKMAWHELFHRRHQ